MAQQLWLNNLSDLSPPSIVAGTRRAINESEYLPTPHTIRKYCDPRPEDLGLIDAHSAYLEACNAPSPKNAYQWSHPAVYLAGNASDWFFLASSAEAKAFPVFKHNYELLIERLMRGEQLETPVPKAIPETIQQPLTNEERKQRLKALREELNL
jgi:hypothetical protein